MSQKVKFFRYWRPLDPKTGLIDSQKGITFRVVLNYKTRKMNVSLSVCNGDNFSKEIGKAISKSRYKYGDYLEYDLDDFCLSGESVMQYLKNDAEAAFPWLSSNDVQLQAAAKQLEMA